MRRMTRDDFDPTEILKELRADSIYDDSEVRRLLEEACHAPAPHHPCGFCPR